MSTLFGADRSHMATVATMDEALGMADRIIEEMMNCPGDYPGGGPCEKCRQAATLMRARIRKARGFHGGPDG